MSNIVKDKSYAFALRIIKLNQFLREDHHEYVLSKQVLRSGTSIGALVRESEHAESRADFIHKLSIALKEANETDYWLSLLKESGFIKTKDYSSISTDNTELIKLLIKIIKSSKQKK